MPKKMDPQDVLGRLDWLNKLPETQWSKELTNTSLDLVGEIEKLEAQKATIDAEIKKRTRVLRSLPSRADREAALIYPEDVVSKVKPQQQ
jgi:hypothetical protein